MPVSLPCLPFTFELDVFQCYTALHAKMFILLGFVLYMHIIDLVQYKRIVVYMHYFGERVRRMYVVIAAVFGRSKYDSRR